MNKISKLLSLILIIMLALVIVPRTVHATSNLDEIQDYTIQVDVREDGTLDISYHLVWKVLNDKDEGPLTWVKIGIPNNHVDEIKGLSDNISKIKYYNSDGSHVRIDLDREYYKDEILTFDFSIHQSYMYRVDQQSNECDFSFTPGWFDEIQVKNITLKWNQKDVIMANTNTLEGDYYIWNDTLNNGEKLKANVTYSLDSLMVNENEQASSSNVVAGAVIFVIAFLVIIAVAAWAVSKDDYKKHSGLGRGTGNHGRAIHSSSHSCVHSCACACACAGGGRAGCSTKDFYHTNLQTNDIKKVLAEKL